MLKNTFNTFEIITTWACNLHCTYCYEKELIKNQAPVAVKDIVNFIRQTYSPQKTLHFQFMGGEPLIAPERLLEFLAELETIPEKKHYSLTTNLTSGSRELLDKLSSYGMCFLVSLDGQQFAHDQHRGQGSFAKTMQGLAYLLAKKTPTEIRMTITPETIEQFKTNFLFVNSLNIPFSWVLTTDQDYSVTQCEHFVKDLHALYGNGYPLNDTTIKKALTREKASAYCINPETTISIAPNGALLNCSGLSSQAQGSIYSGDISYDTIVRDFFVNTRDNKECLACATYLYCKGGCASAKQSKEQKDIFCKTQRLIHVFIAEQQLFEVTKKL